MKLYAYMCLVSVQRKKWDSVSQKYTDSLVKATRVLHFTDIDVSSIQIEGVHWTRADKYDIVVGA